jgi:hypothetical protein
LGFFFFAAGLALRVALANTAPAFFIGIPPFLAILLWTDLKDM